MQKIFVSPIKGGAILFTIKVVMNLLLVREIMGQVSVWCQVRRASGLRGWLGDSYECSRITSSQSIRQSPLNEAKFLKKLKKIT